MKKVLTYLILVLISVSIFACKTTTESDNTPPTIELTNPEDNSEFPQGTIINVTADANDDKGIKEVKFYIDDAVVFTDDTSPYEYGWNTGATKETTHSIYARAWDTSNNSSSSNTVTVTLTDEPPEEYITIISPNGGEEYPIYSTITILWEDNIEGDVKIEAVRPEYTNFIATTASDGEYSFYVDWNIWWPDASDYKIKISSVDNNSIFDYSDENFTLYFYLNITSPSSGTEVWNRGQYETINWVTNDITGVATIELYQSGEYSKYIGQTTDTSTTYTWAVPLDIDLSSEYKIKITGGSYEDFSDYDFTISELITGNVMDIENNVYHTVKLGNQEWITENLYTKHYSDGTPIPEVIANEDWKNTTAGAWCAYNNEHDNIEDYGILYNSYAVAYRDGLAPTGWHVPSEDEWWELYDFLGLVTDQSGGSVKNTGTIEAGTGLWHEPNTGATNSSLLSIIPGGYRNGVYGNFSDIGKQAFFWASDNPNWNFRFSYDNNHFGYVPNNERSGCSIRCVKDQ